LNANSNPANALRQLDSTTRFRETKRPVLLDRVADENTGKRVKVEKTATGPEGGGAAGHGRSVENIATTSTSSSDLQSY
jgi:hypothetical protein